jgi:hypothetical protein
MLKVIAIFILISLTANAKSVLVPTDFRLGTRLQSVMVNEEVEKRTGAVTSTQDFFLRRARLQVGLSWGNGWSQYFDIRNDKINKGNSGEGDFNLGDASLQYKKVSGDFVYKTKFFRSKVDVSRSSTVSSSRLLYLNRVKSVDFASNYISHNRRATNLQWNGSYKNRIDWHLVSGDSVESGSFDDVKGENAESISQDKFMVGAKVRFHIFENKSKKITETFFDGEDHFTIGAGAFHLPEFTVTYSGTSFKQERNLINTELSFHMGNFTLLSEYFNFSSISEDFTVNPSAHNESEAFYVQGEYKIVDKWRLFYRYEYWNKAKSKSDYDLRHYVLGVNHYIDNNNVRIGAYYDQVDYGSKLSSNKSSKSLLLTAMLHFY